MWRCAWPAARGQKVLLAPFESARGADARIQSFLQRPGCCLHCPAGAAALLAKVSAQAWCAGFGQFSGRRAFGAADAESVLWLPGRQCRHHAKPGVTLA